MADAKKGIPAVGGAGAAKASASGQKRKNPGKQQFTEDGRLIKPVLYNGRASGHGLYYAAYAPNPSKKDETVWDAMLLDPEGKPVPFRHVGVSN